MTANEGEEILRPAGPNVSEMPTTVPYANDKEEVFFVATKAVILLEDGKMLTLLRGKDAPTNPLGWDLPGGVLEHGEEADHGAMRETKEETGLDIMAPRVFHAIARANQLGEYWMTIYFFAYAASDAVKISWEHDEYKWIVPGELDGMQASNRIKEALRVFIQLRDAGKI